MRGKLLWLVAVSLFLPAAFSEAQDDVGDRILKRIDDIMSDSEERLRRDLLDVVRGELGEGGSRAPVDKPKGLSLITEAVLRKHAGYLAGDELKGRMAGTPGARKATAYIAKVFREAGLKPAGDAHEDTGEKTYYQNFRHDGRDVRNCLGLLEGTDPVLKKEIVVVGAHHDHCGSAEERFWGRIGKPSASDGIWNGADDNASGTSAVLNLAKAFGEGSLRPKRSILFITFTAEESGLNGSKHYVENPIAPLKNHVFMLNLDMIGRNRDRPVYFYGVGSAEGPGLREAVERAAAKTGIKTRIRDRMTLMGGGSDHAPFRDKGIPYIFIFTGFHGDYHRVTDHADKLHYDRLGRVTRTAAHLLVDLADTKGRPSFRHRRLEIPKIDPERFFKPARSLGVHIEDLAAEELGELGLKKKEGALRISRIAEDSAAEKAGLKEGDIVVQVGGEALPRGDELTALRAKILQTPEGKPLVLEIVRNGKRLAVQAKWDK